MSYTYGTKLASSPSGAPKLPQGIQSFPVVGGGLGGIPQRGNSTSSVFGVASYGASNNNPGDITISKPSGTQVGDLLVMCLCNGAPATNDPASFAIPSGWNREVFSSDTPHLSVYTRVATNVEPSSYTVTWDGTNPDGSSGIILRMPKAEYVGNGALGSAAVGTGSINATSFTSPTKYTLNICVAARGEPSSVAATFSNSFTEIFNTNNLGQDNYVCLAIATLADVTGGPSGSCSVNLGTLNGSGQAVIFAVQEI